jgi:hypothetical protein
MAKKNSHSYRFEDSAKSPETPSYIVWTDDAKTYAKDCNTCKVIAEGEDARAVVNQALAQLLVTGGKRVMTLRGAFTLSSWVSVPSDVVLDLTEAALKLPDTLASYSEILRIAGDNVEVIGGVLDGGANGVSTVSILINTRDKENVTVRGATFRNALVGVEAWGKDIARATASTWEPATSTWWEGATTEREQPRSKSKTRSTASAHAGLSQDH